MTKEEAFTAMKAGKKVTHNYFHPDEYIYMIGNNMYDEDDIFLEQSYFWEERTHANWDKNWSIK